MHPVLFHLGPFTLRTYGVLMAVAFVAAMQLAKSLGARRGWAESAIVDLSTWTVLAGLAGARGLYVLLNIGYFVDHPFEVFKVWEGGLVFYGGFLAAVPVALFWIKRHRYPLGEVADVVAPALALGQAIGRWGCLAAGCCYGRPTPLPWGITYRDPAALAPLGIGLHPTQLYESVGNFAIAAVLGALVLRRRWQGGMVFWLYVFLYGLLRYSVEVFRGDDRGVFVGGLSPSQWIAVAAMVVSVTALVVRVAAHDRA